MCDYSLHAVASRAAKAGETLVTTTFRGTATRGFASESDLTVAVCLMPGTELAFTEDVKYDSPWLWTRTVRQRVAKFTAVARDVPDRHHDAIEFVSGKQVLVTQLRTGQRVMVLQLPAPKQGAERKTTAPIEATTPVETPPGRPISIT